MRKTIALVTCFALLSICVPFTYAGTHNPIFRTISVPGEIISSLFIMSPVNTLGLRAFFESGSSRATPRNNGTLDSLRTGGGDFRTNGSLDSLRTGGGDGN